MCIRDSFTALRDNPIRAESLGVDIRGYTLLSFAIGAAYAGIAGGLFGSMVQFIDPAPFTVEASIMMYLMVVVGGPGYFLGPLLGAAVGVILPEWLRFAQAWQLGVLLLGVGICRGVGLALVGLAAFAMGQSIHRLARQPHPRRELGCGHPWLHLVELCHWCSVRRHCWGVVWFLGAVH